MKKEQKFDIFYRLWEHHSNLLWNKIQNVFVMMAAFYTAWFLMLDNMVSNKNGKDWLYLILIVGMCFLVIVMCFYFKNLVHRDTEQQNYFEKQMPEIFKEIKTDSVPNNKIRGRIIIHKMINLCICSCVFLLLFSILCFHINRCGYIN